MWLREEVYIFAVLIVFSHHHHPLRYQEKPHSCCQHHFYLLSSSIAFSFVLFSLSLASSVGESIYTRIYIASYRRYHIMYSRGIGIGIDRYNQLCVVDGIT